MKPIIIVGDICEDVYLFSSSKKENPEHKSDVYVVDKRIVKPGMASNVYLNTLAMNTFASITHNSVEPHIQKTRLFYKDEYISRIDNDHYERKHTDEDLVCLIQQDMNNFDTMIVCDYGKGFWNKERLALLEGAQCPIFIDPYPTTPLEDYPMCTAITPNLKEGIALTGLSDPSDICKKIYTSVACEYVILKLGEQGVMVMAKGYGQPKLFPTEKVNVIDVCGAGDTFIAALATAYLNGREMESAIKIANEAAAITVQHQGVYVISSEEYKIILDKYPKAW